MQVDYMHLPAANGLCGLCKLTIHTTYNNLFVLKNSIIKKLDTANNYNDFKRIKSSIALIDEQIEIRRRIAL